MSTNTLIEASTFDYLIMQIIQNRREESSSVGEAEERIKRIGYEVGQRLCEKFQTDEMKKNDDSDKEVKDKDSGSQQSLLYNPLQTIVTSQWCSYFFSHSTTVQIDNGVC